MHFSLTVLPYLIVLISWLVHCLRLLYRKRDIRRAVEGFIAGIALIDALFIADSGGQLWAFAALLAFVLCHAWQKRIAGT